MFSKLFNKAEKSFKKRKVTLISILVIIIVGTSLFSFLDKNKSPLPQDRFSFMSQDEQKEFLANVENYFQDKPSYKLDASQGVIEGPNKMQYGLDNVAQSYFTNNKYNNPTDNEKMKVISDHFDKLFEAEKKDTAILKDIKDYKKMKSLLAIRLYGSNYAPDVYEKTIYQNDIEGLYSFLVLDLPSTAYTVSQKNIDAWGIDKKELFKLALQNTIKNTKITWKKEKLFDDAYVWFIESDSIYASTLALNLEKYPHVIGRYGSLVSIPHKFIVESFPINDKSVIKAIQTMIIVTDGMYKEGPGSISPNLYWYHDGKFTNLPYEISNKKLQFLPPAEFVDLLNKLSEENN